MPIPIRRCATPMPFCRFDLETGSLQWAQPDDRGRRLEFQLPQSQPLQLPGARRPGPGFRLVADSARLSRRASGCCWPGRNRACCTRSIPMRRAKSCGRCGWVRAARSAVSSGARQPTIKRSTSPLSDFDGAQTGARRRSLRHTDPDRRENLVRRAAQASMSRQARLQRRSNGPGDRHSRMSSFRDPWTATCAPSTAPTAICFGISTRCDRFRNRERREGRWRLAQRHRTVVAGGMLYVEFRLWAARRHAG